MPQMITPYGLRNNQQGTREPSEWEKMLNQARLAMTMDGETALGLALGKGLRYLWDQHLARRHAKQDAENLAKRRHEDNVKQGYDLESWAKNQGLGTVGGGYEGNIPYTPTPIDTASTPATGSAWEAYAQANGLPGTRDSWQEAIKSVTQAPQLTPGELSIEDYWKRRNGGVVPNYF